VTKGAGLLHRRRNCCKKVPGGCSLGGLSKTQQRPGKENFIDPMHITGRSAFFQTSPSASS